MDGYDRWYETYPPDWAEGLIPYGKMKQWEEAGRLPRMYQAFKDLRYQNYRNAYYDEFGMNGLHLLQIELYMTRGVYVHARRRKLKKGEHGGSPYYQPEAWIASVMRELEK